MPETTKELDDDYLLRKFLLAASETFLFPVIAIDGTGKVILLNQATTDQTQVTLREAHKQYLWDVFYDGLLLDHKGSFLSPLVETLVTGREIINRNQLMKIKQLKEWANFSVTTWKMLGNNDISLIWGIYFPVGLARDLRLDNMGSIRSICESVAERDFYTRGHMERVAIYALSIGHVLSISEMDMSYLFIAAMVHDLGKINIPIPILGKPGRLTDEEMAIMQRHPVYSMQLLRQNAIPKEVSKAVLHHHERFDGTGYPSGLTGTDIPLLSRILAVVDAFEAMTSDRVYRQAMDNLAALAELERNAGTQFDPVVVRAMRDFMDSKGIQHCKSFTDCLNIGPCSNCLAGMYA